jgi:cell wall-associated NlpC family hydrolase
LNSQNDQVQGESVLGAPNPATDSLKDQGNATALQTESQSLNSTETSVTQGEKSVLGGQGSVLDAAASGMTGGTGASGASGGATGATGEAPSSPAAMQANVDSQFLQPMTLGEFTKQMGGQALPGSLLSNVPSAVGATGSRGLIIQKAMAQLGTPYVWGGTSPGGFDCSGLVQWAYAQAGINLPRISYAQASSGVRTPISQLQPGDLVAFDENNRNGPGMADHISIYLGNNQILEAPHTGADVRVRTLGPGDETNAWGVSMSSYFGGGSSGSSTGG